MCSRELCCLVDGSAGGCEAKSKVNETEVDASEARGGGADVVCRSTVDERGRDTCLRDRWRVGCKEGEDSLEGGMTWSPSQRCDSSFPHSAWVLIVSRADWDMCRRFGLSEGWTRCRKLAFAPYRAAESSTGMREISDRKLICSSASAIGSCMLHSQRCRQQIDKNSQGIHKGELPDTDNRTPSRFGPWSIEPLSIAATVSSSSCETECEKVCNHR